MALADDMLRLVEKVTIETEYGPTIELNQPFAPNAAPSALLSMLKPRITFDVGGKKISMAPYGDPGPTKWPFVKIALLALVGLAVGGGIAGMLRGR